MIALEGRESCMLTPSSCVSARDHAVKILSNSSSFGFCVCDLESRVRNYRLNLEEWVPSSLDIPVEFYKTGFMQKVPFSENSPEKM